jgi:hypothetical protein
MSVKIDFEITQNGYTLRDALVLPDDYVLTNAEIEIIKQQRFDNWYNVITMPVVNFETPVEDIGNG